MIFGWRLGRDARALANSVADYIGIEHNLFDSALMELGVSWKSWEPFVGKQIEPKVLAWEVREKLAEGLSRLEDKWGHQPEIADARRAIARVLPVAPPPDKLSASIREAREQAILHWVEAFEVPGGYSGARALSVLAHEPAGTWAAATFFAESLNKPVDDIVPALHALSQAGRLDEGRDSNDVPLYRLSSSGWELAKAQQATWRSICNMYQMEADLR